MAHPTPERQPPADPPSRSDLLVALVQRVVWGDTLPSTRLIEEEYTEVVSRIHPGPGSPEAPSFDPESNVSPSTLPPNMEYPPLQSIDGSRGGPPEAGGWSIQQKKGLWVVIYKDYDIPLVVCDTEAQAQTITDFLNLIPGFDAADLPRTVWMP